MLVAGVSQSRISYNQSVGNLVSFSARVRLPKIPKADIFTPEQNELLNHYARVYDFAKKKPVQWGIKRTLDYVGASLLLVAASPIMLVAGALVKVESKGPMFYVQKRIGKMGREFRAYKIRTMHSGSSETKIIESANDPRITKIGKFLRKYSIDEIPQLLNILKGDMSFVGPRPIIIEDLAQLIAINPDAIRRLSVLPGAKLNYKNRNTLTWADEEKEYLDKWSLKNDIIILLKIAKTIILGKNV